MLKEGAASGVEVDFGPKKLDDEYIDGGDDGAVWMRGLQ